MSAQANLTPVPAPFDAERVRADFPILASEVRGKPLVYLDNAASAQKPRAVVDEMRRFDLEDWSNVHRGVHALSERATKEFEAAREKVAAFVGAGAPSEIVWTSGTTAAINLVAASWGGANLGAGDEIVLTGMEHHSNIVPWQLLRDRTGCEIRVVPVTDEGEVRLEDVERAVGPRTKLVSVVHVSNALGTINPVGEIAEIAHAAGAKLLLDGAQAAPHLPIDVAALGCDFYALSGHKLFGPSGIGVLWARPEILEEMPPWIGGGDMIRTVSFERSTYAPPPARFEAGTPNVTGAIGLGAAIDYLAGIDREAALAHEDALVAEATERVGAIEGVRLIGTAARKASVVSFVIAGVHAHDVGTILDGEGVAVRAGHHCTQPLMERFGVAATARASFAFYNTRADVDALVASIGKVKEIFG